MQVRLQMAGLRQNHGRDWRLSEALVSRLSGRWVALNSGTFNRHGSGSEYMIATNNIEFLESHREPVFQQPKVYSEAKQGNTWEGEQSS